MDSQLLSLSFRAFELHYLEPDMRYFDVHDVLSTMVLSKRRLAKLEDEFLKSSCATIERAGRLFVHEEHLVDDLKDMCYRGDVDREVFLDFCACLNPEQRENRGKRKRKQMAVVEDDDDDFDLESIPTVEEEEEFSVEEKKVLSRKQLLFYSQLLKDAIQSHQALQPDGPEHVKKELEERIINLNRILAAYTLVHPLFQEDTTPTVRISRRIHQLYPNLTAQEVKDARLEIGERAADLYREVYGVAPPVMYAFAGNERRFINRFTEKTAPKTVDVAIRERFEQ